MFRRIDNCLITFIITGSSSPSSPYAIEIMGRFQISIHFAWFCFLVFGLLEAPCAPSSHTLVVMAWSTQTNRQLRNRPFRWHSTATTLFSTRSPPPDNKRPPLDKDKIIRRKLLQSLAITSAVLGREWHSSSINPIAPPAAAAAQELSSSTHIYQRQKDQSLSYQLEIPNSFKETQKPVKTHLDEVNFVSDDIPGYQYGITVDPVRINSLQEFGTPEEVAARVVTAEVNRDGVFEVTLLEDPYEEASSNGSYYILQYLSVGKRGNKHTINKIFIARNQLYVLTVQVKQEDWDRTTSTSTTHRPVSDEMKRIVKSFQVLLP